MTTLRAKDLTRDELTHVVRGLQPLSSEPARAWLEAADGWALGYWHGVAGPILWYSAGRIACEVNISDILTRLVAGRVFAPSGELRWRVVSSLGATCCRTVFLGDQSWAPPLLQERHELDNLQSERTHSPLWGLLTSQTHGRDGDPHAWVELKIPHRFHYPVSRLEPEPATIAVKAEIEIWRNTRGETQFVRLCDLQAYDATERD